MGEYCVVEEGHNESDLFALTGQLVYLYQVVLHFVLQHFIIFTAGWHSIPDISDIKINS
jgi:hypothetical protein